MPSASTMVVYHYPGLSFYLLFDLNAPEKTINNPSTSPISIPILIRLIRNPNINPIAIANAKAISPLRVSGCLLIVVTLFLSVGPWSIVHCPLHIVDCQLSIVFYGQWTMDDQNAFFLFSAIIFASNLYAPGTPAGNSLKNTNPVYVKYPLPYFVISKLP